jgi:N4-gp56 family major capsid protein
MANAVVYGDISPRTAAYVIKDLLTRAMPYMVIEKFGQNYPIPQNSTKTAKWRRYFLVRARPARLGNGARVVALLRAVGDHAAARRCHARWQPSQLRRITRLR